MKQDSTRCVTAKDLGGSLDYRVKQWLHNPETILTPFIKEGMTVLDHGCNTGFFTVEMAHLVGETGLVVASDVHPSLLNQVKQKVSWAGFENRLQLHQCKPEVVNTDQMFDFILLYCCLHIIPEQENFIKELKTLLKPDGQVLVVLPSLRVSKQAFQKTIDIVVKNGFIVKDGPKVFLTRTMILRMNS